MSTTSLFSHRSLTNLFLAAFILLVMVSPVQGIENAYADETPCAGLDWEPGPPGGNPVPTVGGGVTDSTGAALPNTGVSLIRCIGTSTIVQDTVQTDSSGVYEFTNMPTTGAYSVMLSVTGDDPTSPQYLGSNALVIDLSTSAP